MADAPADFGFTPDPPVTADSFGFKVDAPTTIGGYPAAMFSRDPAEAGAAAASFQAPKGPQSDFGDWVSYQLKNLVTSPVTGAVDLADMAGANIKQPFDNTPSPGAQRFSQKIKSAGIGNVNEKLNETPAVGPDGKPTTVGALQAQMHPTAAAVGSAINRVASDVGAIVQPALMLTPFAGEVEGEAAVPPEPPAPAAPRSASEPPSDAELLARAQGSATAPPPAAPAAAPERPPVTHTVEEATGSHTFTSPNGVTMAQESGPYLKAIRSDTEAAAQGQGEGVARIATQAEVARARGLIPGSDVSVSPAAAKTWQKYGAESGDTIKQNPSTVNEATGNLVSNDPRVPVFEAHPAPAPDKGPMLNVGMNVGGDTSLTQDQVVKNIEATTGAKVLTSSVHPSGTEPTVVASLDRELTPAQGNALAGVLKQEAIPQLNADGSGAMFGPQAEKWGPFNSEYFLTHEGKPLRAPPPEPGTPVLNGGPAPTTPAARGAALKSLGINETRKAAISGDVQGTSDDVVTGNLNNAAGARMRETLAGEREALRGRTDLLLQRSGGTGGMDAGALYNRGQTQVVPLEAGYDKIDDAIQGMYEEAKARATGPITLNAVQKYLADNDLEFTRSDEAASFRGRVNGALTRLEFDKGPQTIAQAERFRQWLNSAAADFKIADMAYGLKDALDEDVAKAGGADLFKQARALRAFRADNFDTPTGVKSLIAPKAGRLGLNRPVPYERTPDFIAKLPVDQFNHVVSTIGNVAKMFPELAPQSAAALKEIRAQFVNRMRAAGDSTEKMWNAKAVSGEVATNGPKMARVFDTGGQKLIHELQQAGEILRNDNAYKGAAVQTHNLLNTAVLGPVKAGAEALGAHLGGLPGYLAGHLAKGGAGMAQDALLRRAAEGRLIDLNKGEWAEAPTENPSPAAAPKGQPLSTFKAVTPEPLSTKLPGQRGGPKSSAPSQLEQIKQHLTPEEQEGLRADSARNLVEHFNALGDLSHELAAAALEGKGARGWYRNSAEALANAFGPDSPRVTAFMAALSPRNPVPRNFEQAVRSFDAWDKAGRPQDAASIKGILANHGVKLEAQIQNAVRALTDPAPDKLTLSGPKVDSFMRNLRDNVNAVTLDGWQAAFANIDPGKLGGGLNAAGTAPGKSTMYKAYSAHVRQAAAMLTHLTGEKWTPEEVQETSWAWTKHNYEVAESYKGLATIPELVKDPGEVNDLIKATPNFHNLFAQPGYEGYLKSGGGAEGVHGATGKQSAEPAISSEAETAAKKALRPHLERAAQRLEALRQSRAGNPLSEGPP